MTVSDNSYYPVLEGILFAMGEPVEIAAIAFALELDIKSAHALLTRFMKDYNHEHRGMQVIELEDSFQMTTNPDIFEYLIRVAKQPKKMQLTQATLETLAIVAWRQPVTKLDIEKIRGVKSDYMVGRLVEYGMIEEVGRSETVGRPILFGTTKEFLRHFGLKNTDELRSFAAGIAQEPTEEEILQATAEAERAEAVTEVGKTEGKPAGTGDSDNSNPEDAVSPEADTADHEEITSVGGREEPETDGEDFSDEGVDGESWK